MTKPFRKPDQKGSASDGPMPSPDDLAPAIVRDRHSDYRGHRNDATAVADFEIGGVQPQIGPLALQRAIEEGIDPLVDVLAELGNLALRDARQAHCLHQPVDAAGRHAADPGFLNDGHQCLLRGLARLEEGREVGALAQLGDAQAQWPEPGIERAVAVAIAVIEPIAGALVPTGADKPFDIGLHQDLQHRFRDSSQEISFAALLQQLD